MPPFLNPIFLYAVAFAGVPLLIHLIRRRKLKVVQWAAMEFLRQSQKKQRRRMRIEELILLTLRTLIVILACLAFARPVTHTLGAALLSQNQRVYAVLVVDNSYSMGQRGRDGKSSQERGAYLCVANPDPHPQTRRLGLPRAAVRQAGSAYQLAQF